jgi:hypothetical protein
MVVDNKNKIKIPQNDKIFFKINKNKNWKYSIKIEFSYNEEINYFNLFLIIKSYVLNTSFPPYAICVSFIETNGKEIITEKNDIRWIKSIDYYQFEDWINFITEKQSKYERSDEFSGIILLFSKGLVEMYRIANPDIDILEHIKPDYPWKPDFLDKFSDQIETINILKEKIKYYERKEKDKK